MVPKGREREAPTSSTSCHTGSANSFSIRFLVCVNVYTGFGDLKTSGTHVTEPVQLIQIVDYAVLLFIVVVHCTVATYFSPAVRHCTLSRSQFTFEKNGALQQCVSKCAVSVQFILRRRVCGDLVGRSAPRRALRTSEIIY